MTLTSASKIGDGTIFVTALEPMIRIRTGENDEDAVEARRQHERHRPRHMPGAVAFFFQLQA
ncbi:P-II family nitrogen regulator [Halomonas borealis]|uniref:P-II family nitrogen regulator n=1 Tax=Halomonas borealis TaxID=2508710 RepID=UPI003F663A6B